MSDTPPARRPLRRRVMHVVRRAHLYFGLFLLPWAVLYGVTGFLFNHPQAFADGPTTAFGPAELEGTPLASPPDPASLAADAVLALAERATPAGDYALVEGEPAAFLRDFAFATVRTPDGTLSILYDVHGGGGTVRGPAPVAAKSEPAPFAVVAAEPTGERKGKPGGLRTPSPLGERLKEAVPVLLARLGLPTGPVTVTSVPDVSFLMDHAGTRWRVTHNGHTGAVAGARADAAPPEGPSVRRFLTRLHVAHGYPSAVNARWLWAVVVDAMAFVMVFWGVSGLFMWWQLKATRATGAVVVALSLICAAALGWAMRLAMS